MPNAQSWDPSSPSPRSAVPRRAATGAAALTAVVTPMLALASPVSAHNACAHHPTDRSTACLAAGNVNGTIVEHYYLVVCDRSRDGNRANAKTWRNGNVHRLYDQNGGQPGCTTFFANVGSLERFAICVPSENCGSPVWKDQF